MGDPFLGAELGADVPTVDLHGMSCTDAAIAVDRLIHSAFMRSEHVIRVIHGHGSGALKEVVKQLFSRHSNVTFFKMTSGVSYAEIERR